MSKTASSKMTSQRNQAPSQGSAPYSDEDEIFVVAPGKKFDYTRYPQLQVRSSTMKEKNNKRERDEGNEGLDLPSTKRRTKSTPNPPSKKLNPEDKENKRNTSSTESKTQTKAAVTNDGSTLKVPVLKWMIGRCGSTPSLDCEGFQLWFKVDAKTANNSTIKLVKLSETGPVVVSDFTVENIKGVGWGVVGGSGSSDGGSLILEIWIKAQDKVKITHALTEDWWPDSGLDQTEHSLSIVIPSKGKSFISTWSPSERSVSFGGFVFELTEILGKNKTKHLDSATLLQISHNYAVAGRWSSNNFAILDYKVNREIRLENMKLQKMQIGD